LKLRDALATAAALIVLSWAGSAARGDSPPEAPQTQKIFSANQRFFVIVEPAKKTATVFEARVDGKPRETWQMPADFQSPALSDDGRYLVVIAPGGNLIDLDHEPDDTMIWFYEEGKLVGKLSLADLIAEEKLTRTVSHYAWANSFGFEGGHRFRVETVDGRVQVFDVATGRRTTSDR
jgi:hypothetical protein